ncbi:MAG: hypothetical protein CVV27_12920 [Candidatus Melainabacteria bacterium HGW-Melainabacteria-1]|nr:MAG: hypothetical protein CVV27_12920 [Candidatus Melainabacteria bacterium HGW-Melainabacteria-1]
MPSKKIRRNSGLTIFEILTVALIISILALIAIPNFIKSKDDANEATVETNAGVLRTMLETYKVDHHLYPEDLRTLGREATIKKYNKEAQNPFTGTRGIVESGKWAIEYVGTSGPVGMVSYQPLSGNTKYYIFLYDRTGQLLKRKGKVYALSNG